MKHQEETTHIPPPAEKHPSEGCLEVNADHEHTRDPETNTQSEPNTSQDAKILRQSPQGRWERERAAVNPATLYYFKHHDFTLVCSEAAQMAASISVTTGR